jgi:hypothetical protein
MVAIAATLSAACGGSSVPDAGAGCSEGEASQGGCFAPDDGGCSYQDLACCDGKLYCPPSTTLRWFADAGFEDGGSCLYFPMTSCPSTSG